MRLLLSSYSFFIKAPSAAVCKALISLVFYYHPYQSLANATETAKYLAIGSCLDPDETRDDFKREYLFYLYSINFNPVNPEDGKVVFTCRQPENARYVFRI